MMKKKVICGIIGMLIIAALVIGTEKLIIPTYRSSDFELDDSVLITLRNCDYCFYHAASYYRNVMFDIYTTEEFPEDSIEIQIDSKTPYEYHIVQLEDEALPQNIYMSYSGVDWKQMYEEYHTDSALYQKKIQDLTNKYNELKEYPVLHRYQATVTFKMNQVMDGTEECINNIAVAAGGKQYKFDIGVIRLNYDDYNGYEGISDIEMKYPAMSEVGIICNDEGDFVLQDCSFVTTSDVILDDLVLSNDKLSVKKVVLEMEMDGQPFNVEYSELKGIEIPQNTAVNMKVTIHSDDFEHQLFYMTNFLMQIMYHTDGEENQRSIYQDVLVRTKLDAFETYAYLHDNLDMVSYYTEFYNKVYE